MLSYQGLRKICDRDWLLHLQVNRKAVPMEYRRLEYLKRRLGCAAGNLPVVLPDSLRHRFQGQFRSLSITRHHVEGHLDVEYILRQLLEGKQIYRLFMQFVHPLLAVLRRRFKHGRDHALYFGSLLAAQSEQR